MIKKTFDFIKKFILRIIEHDIYTRSAALAYYFIFAIFPSILFLYSLLAFFSLDWATIFNKLQPILPNDVYNLLNNYLILLTPKPNMTFLLTGLITAVYSSHRAVKCIRTGVNLAFLSNKKRSFINESLRSILFTVALYFSILLSFIISPAIYSIFNFFYNGSNNFLTNILAPIQSILSIVPFLVTLILLYYLSPAQHVPFLYVSFGASISTFGIFLFSHIMNTFTINAFKYSGVYGSLAAPVVFIIWLYFTSLIILFGAELCSFVWYNSKECKERIDKQ